MKRLLAYLFIVLGLGLVFSVNSWAGIKLVLDEVKAKNAILIDANTNQVLYEKNADSQIEPAAMTKIMTTIIAFDLIKKGKLSLKDKLLVSENAWRLSSLGYSSMFMIVGDRVSVENLLRGIIVSSGNDACVVLAEGIAGTEQKFVKMMNAKAKEIGLQNTNFTNSTGIGGQKNYSTVRDIATLSSYMIKNYPDLYKYYSEKQFTWNRTGGKPITQGNRNPLLYKNMIGVDGIKTGYLKKEKYQLAASMKFNINERLIVVGSGFKTKNLRSKESAKLLAWGKSNHTVKIAKTEPSQTQEVANTDIKIDLVFCNHDTSKTSWKSMYNVYANLKKDGCNKLAGYPDKVKPNKKFEISYKKFIEKFEKDTKFSGICYSKLLNKINYHKNCSEYESFVKLKNVGSNFYYDDTKKTQIAKAEPTIKPKKKANKILAKNEIINGFGEYIFDQKTTSIKDGCYHATQSAKLDAIRKLIKKKGINTKSIEATIEDNIEIVKDTIIEFGASNSEKLTKCKTEIRAKITIEEKQSTTKTAKVEKIELYQSEETDNEAPVIEIAEAITVNDTSYEIEGKVIDKSKKLFVEIEGETIPVKEGKFIIKRFSPVDEQIKIVAIDQWGNKSKPKLVNITIDIQETELVEKLEALNPSLIEAKTNKNRVALIIGIEKYEQTAAANFANLDAKYFYEYARKGFGISKSNIKLLVDEEANLIQSISTINKWLPSKIKKNKTELIIFFAGHGLASSNGKELYILPQDSDPDLLKRTALSRTELFEEIIKLNPKSVTMFMDTCYSGISRDEQMLLASARPLRIVADEQEGIPDNFTIFSASKLDQISSGLKEAKHGIFSYYLMKGLEGKADSNKDKKITNGELLAYMDENVSQKAAELGRQQNPSLAGDPNKVLMSYR